MQVNQSYAFNFYLFIRLIIYGKHKQTLDGTKIPKIYKNALKTQQYNTGVKSQKPFGKKIFNFFQKADNFRDN